MKYADVIVDITFDKLDKTYQYRIPEGKEGESIQIGSEVYIPFGKGNRRIRGFVTGLSKECKCPPERIKEIAGIADKSLVLESHLIQLAAWITPDFHVAAIRRTACFPGISRGRVRALAFTGLRAFRLIFPSGVILCAAAEKRGHRQHTGT